MYDQSYKAITNLCSSKQHILFQKIKWVLLNSYQDQYGAKILRCLLYQIGKNDRRKCKEMLANGSHSITTNSLKNQHQHKFQKFTVITRSLIICSMSTIEKLEKILNMFKVNNENTRTTLITSKCQLWTALNIVQSVS